MKKLLLTTSAIVGFAGLANAQSLDDKLYRIEKRMVAMEKQVYSGNAGVSAVSADNKLLAKTQADLIRMQERNAELYGKIEELGYAVEQLSSQIKLMHEDVDFRLNDLEKNDTGALAGAAASKELAKDEVKSAAPVSQKAETRIRSEVPEKLTPERLYEKAYNYLTLAEYDKSSDWLETFIERFPEHKYADNSYYWLGEIKLYQEQPKKAISYFAKGLKEFPNGTKAPANLLKLGSAFKQMDSTKHAKNTWNKLIKDYPNSQEATKAKEFLKTL